MSKSLPVSHLVNSTALGQAMAQFTLMQTNHQLWFEFMVEHRGNGVRDYVMGNEMGNDVLRVGGAGNFPCAYIRYGFVHGRRVPPNLPSTRQLGWQSLGNARLCRIGPIHYSAILAAFGCEFEEWEMILPWDDNIFVVHGLTRSAYDQWLQDNATAYIRACISSTTSIYEHEIRETEARIDDRRVHLYKVFIRPRALSLPDTLLRSAM